MNLSTVNIDPETQIKAIKKIPQYGFGPWYVCLAFNIIPNPKKKTQIFVHSSPEWMLDVKNYNEAGVAMWRSVIIIGPFEFEKCARVFKQLWERGPRPRDERLLWGVVLCRSYTKKHGIHIWFRNKEELVLGVIEVEHLSNEKEKRKRIRKGRRGKPGERRQKMYELMTPREREKTLGAIKVRRDIREARKKKKMQ